MFRKTHDPEFSLEAGTLADRAVLALGEEHPVAKEFIETPFLPECEGFANKTWEVFMENKSKLGITVTFLDSSAVILSIVAMFVASDPAYRFPNTTPDTFWWIDFTCTIIISSQWFAPLITLFFADLDVIGPGDETLDLKRDTNMNRLCWFFTQLTPWINFLSFMPFIIECSARTFLSETENSSSVLKFTGFVLTLHKIAMLLISYRALKLFVTHETVHNIEKAAIAAIYGLSVLGFWMFFSALIFAPLVFLFESGEWSDKCPGNEKKGCYTRKSFHGELEETPFISMIHSVWFILATTNMVGYGDMYPVSAGGRLTCIVTFIWGAIGSALLIRDFTGSFEEKSEKTDTEHPSRWNTIFKFLFKKKSAGKEQFKKGTAQQSFKTGELKQQVQELGGKLDSLEEKLERSLRSQKALLKEMQGQLLKEMQGQLREVMSQLKRK